MAAVDAVADPERATSSARFFKTGPGEYGEGDVFAGVPVPVTRRIARSFRGIAAGEVRDILESPVHEHRLIALVLLRTEFDRETDPHRKAAWVAEYRAAVDRGRVNNWDLVDASADAILGSWAFEQGDHSVLVDHARRTDLWTRRVGIIGTFAYLRRGDATATLAVAPIVLDDRRDLIQKAIGWMLREVGKRVDRTLLTDFLEERSAEMGRTALGYAVEHLTPEQRSYYRGLR
ncbi:DNA alkylation repair protein [Gordonia soli]|uniref:DNA alkylation repair enzyme n=1 Tax=Gordonia soli NBRC 108243 TaxID=1223545 RepID=M0QGT9_9ACTN|nr:DNA alkylation repair protein [Gordonia soli]GAC67773.1 hypothetical protein GS4_11_00410 [Gordonia soli NBRC 108243]